MAIEDILRALDQQAKDDCDAVLEEAAEHAKLILDDAQRAAQDIKDGYARQVERVARARAARQVNAARLEAKMKVSSAKGDGVESVFKEAGERLASLRDKAYDSLFASLASEAMAGIDGEITVLVAAEDASRANAAANSAGLQAQVDGSLDTAGGLVVEAYGARVIRRNTLEDRLERVAQFKQADVARVLFS